MLSREHLADGRARAVVVNSGNANACTGAQGMDDARAMAAATARALGIAPDEVVVCSTGVIGKPLPIEAIERGIAHAADELSQERRSGRRRRHPHDGRLGQDEHRDLRAERRRGAHRRDGQGRRA